MSQLSRRFSWLRLCHELHPSFFRYTSCLDNKVFGDEESCLLPPWSGAERFARSYRKFFKRKFRSYLGSLDLIVVASFGLVGEDLQPYMVTRLTEFF